MYYLKAERAKNARENMLISEMKEFEQGRDYWIEYVRINGYAFRPNAKGLKKLSKLLDLNVPHLEKRIYQFLEGGIN